MKYFRIFVENIFTLALINVYAYYVTYGMRGQVFQLNS